MKFLNKISQYLGKIRFNITAKKIDQDTSLSLKKKIYENLLTETFKNFEHHFKKSLLFSDYSRWKIRKYAVKTALSNDINKEFYNLEFGVWKGESANFFSKYLHQLYVFDGFEGIKEDWAGTDATKGYFTSEKIIPKLNSNVTTVVGWVEDTFEKFLEKHNPKINFVHFDMDTYSPTKFVLERIKPHLINNAILIFDQLYNYPGWENGEYKALTEVFNADEFEYKAFNLYNKQCVIKIIKRKLG